jgi:hypothetical protein
MNPTKILYPYHFSQCSCPANQAMFPLFDLIPNNICRRELGISILRRFPSSDTSSVLGPNYSPLRFVFETSQPTFQLITVLCVSVRHYQLLR